jgi:hypothetical protein
MGSKTGRTSRKAERNQLMFIVILGSVTITMLVMMSFGSYDFGDRNNTGCMIQDENCTVCHGGVKISFILEKAQDFKETSGFCQTKGYTSGIESSGALIYCSDNGRYQYFSLLSDFGGYLYEKYK